MRGLYLAAGIACFAVGAVELLAACGDDDGDKTVIVVIEAGTDARSSSSSGGPVNGFCSGTSDIDTCSECCAEQHPEATGVYARLVVQCFCQSDDFCKTVCADELCAQKAGDAGSPCDKCLSEKNEKCGAEVNPKCISDAGCAPILECLGNSSCDEKPQL